MMAPAESLHQYSYLKSKQTRILKILRDLEMSQKS